MPRWNALTITAAPELAESLESFLLDCGAPGLQTEEIDGDVRIISHFAGSPPLAELEAYLDALRDLFPGRRRPTVAVDTITDDGWADSWREHFPPLSIGERLFVHPPWIDAPPAERIGIVLDPGMAFGTGHHASTRGCLVLLERAMQTIPGARVLDLGTGSGILAIAAAKLGAREVWAVDVDREACAIAADNARVNAVAGAIRISDDLAAVPGAFDIVLANLLGGLLIELAGELAARLRHGGIAVGAGLLCDEAPAVRRAWRAAGMADDGELSEAGWMALASRRVE